MPGPTIAPAVAAALIGAAGSVAGGVGSAIAAKNKANQESAMQKEALKGPIRGGSDRAGNQEEMVMAQMDGDVMEKLGAASIPMKNPVYGGQPMDLNRLFKSNPFGQGYSVGNKYNV